MTRGWDTFRVSLCNNSDAITLYPLREECTLPPSVKIVEKGFVLYVILLGFSSTLMKFLSAESNYHLKNKNNKIHRNRVVASLYKPLKVRVAIGGHILDGVEKIISF